MAIIVHKYIAIIATRDLELAANEGDKLISKGWQLVGPVQAGEFEFFLTFVRPVEALSPPTPTLPPSEGEKAPQRASQGRTAPSPKRRGRPATKKKVVVDEI